MPQTYNDPVKAKSREKLYDFIKGNLGFKNPLEMKVMCFPGAEQDGEEALEVKEVYDKLGIPRQNIYGVEFSRERANRLKKANLGIQVYQMGALDFFSKTEETFDIISLDYTGNFGDAEFQALQEIIGNRRLDRNGVLATNFFGSRENLKNKISLYVQGSLAGHFYGDDTQFKNFDSTLIGLISKENKQDLSKIRDYIPIIIYGLLGSGKNCKGIAEDNVLFRSPVKDIADNRIRDIIKRKISFIEESQDRKKLEEFIKQNKSMGIATVSEILGRPLHFNGNLWADAQRQTLAEYLCSVLNCEMNLAKGLVYLLEARHSGGYFLAENKSYRYISNSKSPMLMDLFYARSYEHMLKNVDDILRLNPEGINFNPLKMTTSRLNTKLRQMLNYMDKSIGIKFPEREFLGSSYVPQKKERLAKDDLVYLIQSCVPTEEIISAYGGHTKMEIAGIKAWLTKLSRLSQ